MEFPSLEFMKVLQTKLNANSEFYTASKWSDIRILLCIGDNRYCMKLYGGKVIDVFEDSPSRNPLGWDFLISGSLEAWEELRKGKRVFGDLLNYGQIITDGNRKEANRMTEAIHLIASTMLEE